MLSAALVEQLLQRHIKITLLESDALRKSFPTLKTYGEEDRQYFYGSVAFIGQILTESGVNVIFDATANRRSYRDRARQQIPRFLEVYVDTPLEVCLQRDPKGIYKKARTGLSKDVPGLQVPYEPPVSPDLVIHGDREDADTSAQRVIQLLETRGLIESSL